MSFLQRLGGKEAKIMCGCCEPVRLPREQQKEEVRVKKEEQPKQESVAAR